MSYFTIREKATTQSEASLILDLAYEQETAHGVPIHTIKPDLFKAEHFDALYGGAVLGFFDRKRMHAELSSALQDLIIIHAPQQIAEELLLDHPEVMSTKGLAESLKHNGDSGASSKRIYHPNYPGFADQYSPSEYIEPIASVIIAPSINMTGETMMYGGLPSPRGHSRSAPGFKEQWQFRVNEHERAHGAGAGEAQADAMSAIVTRQAFVDCSMLKASADARAIKSILAFEYDSVNPVYGWSTVEVNDDVARMPESTVDSFTSEQIKDIRFQKFEPQTRVLTNLGHVFRGDAEWDIRAGDHEAMSDIAAKISQNPKISKLGPNAQHIMERFSLACKRFAIGADAYDDNAGLISDDDLEVERRNPVTYDGLTPE